MSGIVVAALGGAGLMAVTFASQGYRGFVKNGSPTTEYNKRLVRKLYKKVWNERDETKREQAIDSVIDEDHVLVDPSNPVPTDGPESYKEMVTQFRTNLPNCDIKIDMLVAEGSRVTALLTFSTGVVPGNDKTAVWTATSILEFAGGQVVKTWVNSDALSALIQLGLVPDMASGPFKRMRNDSLLANGMEKVTSQINVVDALLGRKDEHPQEVLTGDDWYDYFLEQSEMASRVSATHAAMLKDPKSGLDMAV
jgi:predicted ester cyclase